MTILAPPQAIDRLAMPVAVAVGLSILIAVAVAKLIMKASVALRRAVELLGDGAQFAPPRAPTAELSALAAALDDAQRPAQHRLREARLREAELERSRREMLAGIGHDLRTPLARLRSVVEALLEEGLSDPAVLDSYLAVLQSQTMPLSALVDEVVELTRITSGLVDPGVRPPRP